MSEAILGELRKKARDLGIELDKPSPARVYDAGLGGTHNYAIDRAFLDQQLKALPDLALAMRWNRAWVGRAVRFAIKQGVRQFVDIGSGLPTQGNIHEVADIVARGEATVVYIDNDPIVQAHSELLLAADADPARHRAVCGSFFDYDDVWEQVLATRVIDLAEPVCLVLAAVLHFMPPATRPEIPLTFYLDQLPPGSLLALSHAADVGDPALQQVANNYKTKATLPGHLRKEEEIQALFGDFELVEPGLTWITAWRPDADTDRPTPEFRSRGLAGVGRKVTPEPPQF